MPSTGDTWGDAELLLKDAVSTKKSLGANTLLQQIMGDVAVL